MNSNELFIKANELDYPASGDILSIREMKPFGFFPGGPGTFNRDRETSLNEKKYMFLGQDFGTVSQYEALNESGDNQRNNATWKNMLPFIEALQIKPDDCFFTNAIMGLRSSGSSTGKSKAWKDPVFFQQCIDFLQLQISEVNPDFIFVMGKETAQFVAKAYNIENWGKVKNIKELFISGQFVHNSPNDPIAKFIYVTHPSFRPTNISKRWGPENDEELRLTIEAIR